MTAGFFLASRLPDLRSIVTLALAMELFVGWAIRDNLTLNILMLVHPVESGQTVAGGRVVFASSFPLPASSLQLVQARGSAYLPDCR